MKRDYEVLITKIFNQRWVRVTLYVILTIIIETFLIYGFAVAYQSLDPATTSYKIRQYFYYASFNIGYPLFYNVHTGSVQSDIGVGFGALGLGFVGWFAFIFAIGEVIARTKGKMNR
jgi:hypothetical protein